MMSGRLIFLNTAVGSSLRLFTGTVLSFARVLASSDVFAPINGGIRFKLSSGIPAIFNIV